MTSRERVLMALRHEEADRVPYNLRPSPEAVARLQEEAGPVEFADYFGHDVRYVGLALPEASGEPGDRTPLPTAEAIAAAADAARRFHERGQAVCGSYFCGVFEQAKHWLGDAETLIAPFEDPRRFAAVLDEITEWKCAKYGAYAAAGVDIVWIGDDLGTQRSLVMSPAQYREWYRPRHERIVAHVRALAPAPVKIAFHCCGHVTPLIPDLIEIGIDVLEAVQAEAMDIGSLKREYGRDLCFWGGVGAQSVLARTTPEQVRTGVRETLAIMAPGGGYIAAPCHTLTDEVSWEAIVAYHEAVREHRY